MRIVSDPGRSHIRDAPRATSDPHPCQQADEVTRAHLFGGEQLLRRRKPQDHRGSPPSPGGSRAPDCRRCSPAASRARSPSARSGAGCPRASALAAGAARATSRPSGRRGCRPRSRGSGLRPGRPCAVRLVRVVRGHSVIASTGQRFTHFPQPLQSAASTCGRKFVVWTGSSSANRRAAIIASQQQPQQLQMKAGSRCTFSPNWTRLWS